jgi:hypothetical protein
MPEPHLRAADTDREAVARRLGEHMSAGRLSLAEYEERLGRAWAAKTYGDLGELTADLPAGTTPGSATAPSGVAAPYRQHAGSCGAGPWAAGGSLRSAWAGWFTTALVIVTVWLAISLGGGGFHDFWPIWVIGPWGAVLLARTLNSAPPRHDRPSAKA